jgi:hypothetical protein
MARNSSASSGLNSGSSHKKQKTPKIERSRDVWVSLQNLSFIHLATSLRFIVSIS